MGSRRAIYTDIAPRPRAFLTEDEKTEVEAAISVYIAQVEPIYIINVSPYCDGKVYDQDFKIFNLDGLDGKASGSGAILCGSNPTEGNF